MIDNMIGALVIAWILSWFGFDKIVIDGMQQFFSITINTNGYYFGAALIGIAAAMIHMPI
jgi:hypothetical protein